MAAGISSQMDGYAFHVFLSFRGEDTSKTFADHLYTALINAGIRTFRDDDEIRRGEKLKLELEKAIQQSRSSVIVLSEDYASSERCLDELAMIVERRRTCKHIIIPVFYDVDPSHVRKQTEIVGKAFKKHEERIMVETDENKRENLRENVRKWRTALTEAADLGGLVLENQADRHESKFIQIIIEEIMTKLDFTVLGVTPYPTGIKSHVEYINFWLQDGLSNVRIMVICGMGGIGKTTIAKIVFNLNFDRFEGCSFLANIREAAKQLTGLVDLQKQLFSDILKRKTEKISFTDEGITKIKDALHCKRVLIVLDDVDELDRVNALFGTLDWFQPGSKVIITTRHEQLLKPNKVQNMYSIKELNHDEALRLLIWHAFGQDKPNEDYMELTKRVIHYCDGLPLALEVLGSSLCGETVGVWESALAKWRTHFPEKIHNVLKISYDALGEDEKSLFLDIACFFTGKDKDYVVKILEVEEDDFPAKIEIRSLFRMGLVKVHKDNNKLTMHKLLKDMGREIIRRESREPGKRSRLWCQKDAFNVLREKTGTDKIEGLSLNLEDTPVSSANNAVQPHFDGFRAEPVLPHEGNPLKRRRQGLMSWMPNISALRKSSSEPDEADFETDAFSHMHNLRLLELNKVRLTGGYGNFPKNLRWLCWSRFHLKFIPNDFPLERLHVLELHNSSLEKFWKRPRLLGSLKILDLSYSDKLANTPDFSCLPNLERLILEYCINLVTVHESIGELKKLVLLNLQGCRNLQKLPQKVIELKSLEKLILAGCSSLDRMPDINKMVLEVHQDY